MRPRTDVGARSQKSSMNIKGDGPNWVLIAGGALLSTLSIRLGCKLKQAFESKQTDDTILKGSGSGKPNERRMGTHHSHPSVYSFGPENENYFNCVSGTGGMVELKNPANGQNLTEPDASLSLVTVSMPEYTNRENGMAWVSSPERVELPPRPLHHHSNCSDSPCASDSGSDVFTRREVIHKLRQQLKRRDEMILEMQDQIADLQNVVSTQMAHSSHLQSQLDVANRELFESEREIQRLRKAIADHCVGYVAESNDLRKTKGRNGSNGHANGYVDGESKFNMPSENKDEGDGGKINVLKGQIKELKEVIEGKEFLVQNYKEQKSELSIKIKELQHKLDSQLPNIL